MKVVGEYGTRLVRTRVLDLGEGRFAWERRAGEARGAPLEAPDEAAAAAVVAAGETAPSGATPAHGDVAASGEVPAAHEAAPGGVPAARGDAAAVVGVPQGWAPTGVRFVLPVPGDDDALLYPLPGAMSAARLLHVGVPELLQAALHGTGAALRALHAVSAPAALPNRPPGLARLENWLRDGDDGFSRQAKAILGAERWTRARNWCEMPGEVVLLHGNPSLGLLVPSPRPGIAGLVTGEDLARGPASLDLGWLLGELDELEHAASHALGGAPSADYAGLRAAVLEGYGAPAPLHTDRVRTLRILAHARDYAAFVGEHEDLKAYAALVAESLDRPIT